MREWLLKYVDKFWRPLLETPRTAPLETELKGVTHERYYCNIDPEFNTFLLMYTLNALTFRVFLNIASGLYFTEHKQNICVLSEDKLLSKLGASSSTLTNLYLTPQVPKKLRRAIANKRSKVLLGEGIRGMESGNTQVKNDIFDLVINNNFKVTNYRFRNNTILGNCRYCTKESSVYYLKYYEGFKIVDNQGPSIYLEYDISLVQLNKIK